jgi:hypothetical protein
MSKTERELLMFMIGYTSTRINQLKEAVKTYEDIYYKSKLQEDFGTWRWMQGRLDEAYSLLRTLEKQKSEVNK